MTDNAALDKIKEVYDDGCAEINGREYIFTKTNHKKRIKIHAFLTQISGLVQDGNHSFFGWDEFEKVERIISDMVLFDGMQLSKRKDHWDEYPEDYILFTLMAMQVICYPLHRGIA